MGGGVALTCTPIPRAPTQEALGQGEGERSCLQLNKSSSQPPLKTP